MKQVIPVDYQTANTLGKRLRQAMAAAGVKNQRVAEVAGVHVKTVSYWLNDRQVPDPGPLDAVAELLGTTANWLRYGNGAVRETSPQPSDRVLPARPMLPPKAYARVYGYLERMRKAGVPEDMIEESERVMAVPVYSKLNKRDMRERSEDELITDIDAAWSWIAEILEREWGIKP